MDKMITIMRYKNKPIKYSYHLFNYSLCYITLLILPSCKINESIKHSFLSSFIHHKIKVYKPVENHI